MNKILKSKKGSMMFDYFILLLVGLFILFAFISFLGEGERLIFNSVEKYRDISSEDENSLGSFKK